MSEHPGAQESMIVRLSQLDRMLELAGEVIIVSSNLTALTRHLNEGATVDRIQSEDVKELAITSQRISSDLHNLVVDVRTVDMRDLFARFRRLARDTSRRLGKPIQFEAIGEETTIDKKVSEKIYDPIAHQIRNAVAHGIEDAAARAAAGKAGVGRVTLSVRNLENATAVEIRDDGKGIDEEAVRAKLAATGLLPAEQAEALTREELYDYLFVPGFSTASETSSTSGRGVGLDVVRSVMNEIGGETRIESEPGQGTTFTFLLPLVTAVNISDALLVRARETTFAFPISSVVASRSIPRSAVTTTTGKGRSIMHLGRLLPLFDLMGVFGESPVDDGSDDLLRVLIVEHKHRKAAYAVSDFLAPQKVVISEFDEGLAAPGLSGTATLSGRKMGMVVDMQQLFEETFGRAEGVVGALGGGLQAARSARLAGEEPGETARAAAPVATAPAETGGEDVFALEEPGEEFLKELEEMLNRLNRELLELEETRDAEKADSVFRLVHSIKGNFTMYGADEPASAAHAMETILERGRRDATAFAADAFDVLFDGSAYLEEVVKRVLAGEPPGAQPEKLATELEAFERRMRPQTPAEEGTLDLDAAQVRLDPTGEFYLSSRRRDGAAVYQARIAFDPGDQPRFLVAFLILRRIQRVADVLGCNPPMADVEAGICKDGIVVLFAPRENPPDLLERMGANLKQYYGVTRFDASPYA